MNIAWLVAVLNPSDVGSHHNFDSRFRDGPLKDLADQMQGFRDLHDDDPDKANYLDDSIEGRLVEAAKLAFTVGSVHEGADKLKEISIKALRKDICLGAVAAILAAVAFAELGRPSIAINVLDGVIGRLRQGPRPSASSRLVRAALHQQRAFRLNDSGGTGRADANLVLTLLDGITFTTVPPFSLSPGVGWNSTVALEDVAAALSAAAALALAEDSESDDVDWPAIIRAKPDFIGTRTANDAYESMRIRMIGEFETRTGSALTQYSQSADVQLWVAQMSSEVLGSPGARRRRLDLGLFRFLEFPADGDMRQDALRLFRQSGDSARVRSAGLSTRHSGPLEAIRADLTSIIWKAGSELITSSDVVLIDIGADLLTKEETKYLGDVVFDQRGGVPSPTRAARRLRPNTDVTLGALGSLARNDPESDQLALLLLMILEEEESLAYEDKYVSAIKAFNWIGLSANTRLRWTEWLAAHKDSDLDEVKALIATTINDIHPTVDLLGARWVSGIAHNFNFLVSRGLAPQGVGRDQVIPALVAELRKIQSDAREGRASFGGYSVVDMAMGYATQFDAAELWVPLGEILSNSNISRHHTELAFDRLSHWPGVPPDSFLRTLAETSEDVLQGKSPLAFWDSVITPYPAALRCFTSYGLVDEASLMQMTAILAGGRSSLQRSESAKTLSTAVGILGARPWIVALSTQLSFDIDPGVAAAAGRVLGLVGWNDGSGGGLVVDRVCALLDGDGTLGPLLTISGLAEVDRDRSEALPAPVKTRLERLSRSHLDRVVRKRAADLLRQAERLSTGLPSE